MRDFAISKAAWAYVNFEGVRESWVEFRNFEGIGERRVEFRNLGGG